MTRREILRMGDRRMLKHRCGRCMAQPDVWCTTGTGRRAATLHAARFYAATAAGDLPLTDADLVGL